jgi:hypothetical protein
LRITFGPSLGNQVTLVHARPLLDFLTQTGQFVKSIDRALSLSLSCPFFQMLTDQVAHYVRDAALFLSCNLNQRLVLLRFQ